jgi:hypothetical protein
VEAPVILEANGRRRMRIRLSKEEVPASKASCLMSNGSGNVSSTMIKFSVSFKSHADRHHSARLSSLATPGSGLLHLDDNMGMTIPGCCSLPTQPMNMTPTAAQPTYPSPQSFSLPDSESFELDAPIRVYDSDQSLCVALDHAWCISPMAEG